jgi:hypothetical protein
MTKKKQDKSYVGHPFTLASTQQIVVLMLIKYYVATKSERDNTPT